MSSWTRAPNSKRLHIVRRTTSPLSEVAGSPQRRPVLVPVRPPPHRRNDRTRARPHTARRSRASSRWSVVTMIRQQPWPAGCLDRPWTRRGCRSARATPARPPAFPGASVARPGPGNCTAKTPGARRVYASAYHAWILEGPALLDALAAHGVSVIKVFLTASWTRWHGGQGPRTRAAWTRHGLAALGLAGVAARTTKTSETLLPLR